MRRYGGRRFGGGGGRFRKAVTGVVSKMNGLSVAIENNNVSMTNAASFSTVGLVGTPDTVRVFTVGSPQDLSAVIPAPVITNDAKVYLRQNKKDYYIHNQGPPGWLKITYFRVRRAINVSSYPTFINLLGAENITITNYAAPMTTGNPAQRYLKFGKTKLVKMLQGAIYHFKINLKFRAHAYSTDVEGDTTYLATKITKGAIVHWIPHPTLRVNGLPASSYTGLAPGPYQLDILEQEYTSYYNIGDNDPTSQMTSLSTPTGAICDIMMPGATHWTPVIG